MTYRSLSLGAALAVLATALGCGPDAAPATELSFGWDSPTNLLVNGSFEEGREPWFNLAASEGNELWADFAVSDAQAKSGSRSLLLEVRSEGYSKPARVIGAIQSFTEGAIPSYIAGWYRVENWKRGTEFQTIQVVVSIHGASGFDHDEKFPTQLAWMLDGAEDPPYTMTNRKFIVRGKKRLVRSRWRRFTLNLEEDFREAWGELPLDYERIDVFFEGRFDRRDPAGAKECIADVYFDDLYFGNGE